MIVQCIATRLDQVELPSEAKELVKESFGSYEEYALTVTKNYVVYGVEKQNGVEWYFVADDNYNQSDHLYPIAHPSYFFQNDR